MGDPVIRTATRSDYEALARLQLESWQTAYHTHLPAPYLRDRAPFDLQDQWRSLRLGPDDFILVAFRDDMVGPAGFLSLHCRPEAFIEHLHCAPAIRSKGTGAALLKAAFERVRAMNRKSVSLSVLVGNSRARAFYLREGAVPGRIRRESIGGYPVDTELMHWNTLSLHRHQEQPTGESK